MLRYPSILSLMVLIFCVHILMLDSDRNWVFVISSSCELGNFSQNGECESNSLSTASAKVFQFVLLVARSQSIDLSIWTETESSKLNINEENLLLNSVDSDFRMIIELFSSSINLFLWWRVYYVLCV